jgi:hypothetical protein
MKILELATLLAEGNENSGCNPEAAEKNGNRCGRPPTGSDMKSWFGRSVVTKGGKPLLVYHSSHREPHFVERKDKGTFFSEKPRTKEFGGHITPAYLKIENPYSGTMQDIEAVMGELTDKQAQRVLLEESGYDVKTDYGSVWEELPNGDEDPRVALADTLEADITAVWQNRVIMQAIRNAGFDGVIANDPFGGSTEYLVFSPSQIRVAAAKK